MAKRETSPQSLTPSTQEKAEAEECFWKAPEITRKQRAKSLELRAVMSLVSSRQQQVTPYHRVPGNTKHEQAKKEHNLLSELYGWFTKGFDTKDLQEAKALLEELS
jgi:hypothetical protein